MKKKNGWQQCFQVECGTGAWTSLDLSQMWCALCGNWKIPPTHTHTLGPKYSCLNNTFVKSRENCSQLTKKSLHKRKELFPSLKGRGESEFSLPWKVLNISAWQGSRASLGNHCVWRRRDLCRVVKKPNRPCVQDIWKQQGLHLHGLWWRPGPEKQRPEAAAPILELI